MNKKPKKSLMGVDLNQVDRIFERNEEDTKSTDLAGDVQERAKSPTTHRAKSTETLSGPLGLVVEKIGDSIGRYKLLEKIGEGGFGIVYIAQQRSPVTRRVALKIIKPGMDSKQVIGRFETERQALAMMDHPSIAKVHDAGATTTGRPYFVMELVKGIAITQYCYQEKLSTRQRLDLVIPVCHAIQHAHQKGIIHRDLKPSNILITLHDGVAVPKVIDFGIAKATHNELTEKTVYTHFHQFIGTPAYMSPEQAEMSGLDIDTRSDIYSLGVLLYELLTGTTPFDTQELVKAGQDEIRKIIREREPEKPSTRLSQTLSQSERQSRLATSHQPLATDLDWIVMKCLEKDRTRRYDTANGLAMDIQRHLANEPIVARPPSAIYKLQKAWRRNKVVYSAAALVATALVIGTAISTWQARAASDARIVAEGALAESEQNFNLAVETQNQLEEALTTATVERERSERSEYIARMNLMQHDWQQGNMARVWESLEASGTFADLGPEWYFWQQQLHQGIRTLAAHADRVGDLTFSPDGSQFATASNDGTVKLWQTDSWRLMRTFSGHAGWVRQVAFSPDGHWLLAGSTGPGITARIWEVASGKAIVEFNDLDEINCVDWSSDGKQLLMGGHAGEAFLWDVGDIDFKPSVARDQAPEDWSLESPHLVRRLPYGSKIWDVAFSSDGAQILIVGDSGMVRLWSQTESEREFRDFVGHTELIRSVAFSADNRWIVSGGQDDKAIVWDAATGRRLDILEGHTHWVGQSVFSANGDIILTVCFDGTVKVWTWDGVKAREIHTLKGHHKVCWAARFLPDNEQQVMTTGNDGTVQLWDLSTIQPLQLEHDQEVTALAFLANGRRLLTGGADGILRLWNLDSLHIEKTIPNELSGFTGLPIRFIVPSPNEQWIVVARHDDSSVSIWGLASGRERYPALQHESDVWAVDVSSDGRWIATGGRNGLAHVWEADLGEKILEIHGDRDGGVAHDRDIRGLSMDSVTALAFSNKGHLWIGRNMGPVTIWDIDQKNQVGTLSNTISVTAMTISFDERLVAIVPRFLSSSANVWDAATGKALFDLVGHKAPIDHLSASLEGRRILTASRIASITKFWETTTGKEVFGVPGRYAALSKDSNRIATAVGNIVRVWTAATPEQVARWQQADTQLRQSLEALRGN